MRPLLLIAFLALSSSFLNGQTCIPIYKKTYGGTGNDEALDIASTADKGAVVIGQTTSNTSGDYDAFIMKLNESGAIEWSKRLGGSADDKLVRVKQTNDGGFVAIGTTKSFGNASGEIMLVKTDAGGIIQWSRHYGKGSEYTKAKEVIQLSDGGYAFVANEMDSSVQANGIVCRLDAGGNIIWTRTFDQGDDDGFNFIIEDANSLYVSGYSTIDRRDGILMCLNTSNGNVIYAKKFLRTLDWNDEVLNIERDKNGLSFGASSYIKLDNLNNYGYYLTLFKMRDDGTIYFQRRAEVAAAGSRKIEAMNIRTTYDSGFIYAYNDTTGPGFPVAVEIGPTGLDEWGRQLFDNSYSGRVRGLDRIGNEGYLIAGYVGNFQTGNKNKITVFKTTITGNTGNCTQAIYGNFIDSTNYTITNFIWNSINSSNLTVTGAVNLNITNAGFNANVACEQQYCFNDNSAADSCAKTFLVKSKSIYSTRAWDITAVPGGDFITVGEYAIDVEAEPQVTRLKPNGEVVWSKTLNNYMHTAFFKRVLTANDGNVIMVGVDNLVVDHGSGFYTSLVKVNSSTGQVVWARYCLGDAYDISPTDDGGYVLCINVNWGFPPIYPFVIRIDANGNLVWQRRLYYSTGGTPVYRGILFEGPFIYIAADYYNTYYPESPNTIQVEKLDAKTGGRYWAKRYRIDGESPNLEAISKVGDTLFAIMSLPDVAAPTGKRHAGVLRLTTDGEEIGSFKINSLDFAGPPYYVYTSYKEHSPRHFTKTTDNNFLFGDESARNGDTSLTIMKFTTTGQVLWAREYSHLKKTIVSSIVDNYGSLLVLGRQLDSIYDNTAMFEGVIIKTDPNGIVDSNSTGECYSQLVPTSKIPLTVQPWYETADSIVNSDWIKFVDYNPYDRPAIMWAAAPCSIESSCNSLNIVGNDRVCHFSDTITYYAQRNANCNSIVAWHVDPLDATVISSTDTSVRIKFLPGRQTSLIAYLNAGCRLLSDTLLISVAKDGGSLDLGPDSVLCPSNKIVLNAHSGYTSYKWQDNSTDSLFTISQPGTYYVTTTDACGDTFSDSVHITPSAPIPFNIGADRTKCNNDTLHLDAPSGFLNYTWSPTYNMNSVSLQHIIVNPSVDTSYSIIAEKTPGCFAYDTIRITVHSSPPINLGPDKSFCAGDSVTLNAGQGFNQYLWNTGETTQQITVNAKSNYSVIGITTDGCKSYDTLQVTNVFRLPAVHLDHDSTLCAGDSRRLDAEPGFTSYLWSSGNTSSYIIVNEVGLYSVTVTDSHGCKGSDTTAITTMLPLPTDFLPSDTSICSYGKIELEPDHAFREYLWSNNSKTPGITISEPGPYWLRVVDNNNCKGTDTVIVSVKDCMEGFYCPSAFTPNNDGKNDIFRPLIFGNVKKYHFTIYNRWGQIVFQTTEIGKGWDGKLGGIQQDPNVFVWTCVYQLDGEEVRQEKGTVTLIR